jgi:hypothetical protein
MNHDDSSRGEQGTSQEAKRQKGRVNGVVGLSAATSSGGEKSTDALRA